MRSHALREKSSTRALAASLAAASLAASALIAACSGSSSERPLSVVLITMDTTRADVLSPFGGRADVTPALGQIARECVLYDAARSVAPLTLPSHSSMLTGLYPTRHTVRDNGLRALPSSATTLAERAHAAGFATAAFVSAAVLESDWGTAQGFDVYDQPTLDPTRTIVQIQDRPAAETVAHAIEWLDGERARNANAPHFVWVHLFDPHSPYRAAPEFVTQAKGDPYQAEVAAMDHAIGVLVEHLRDAKELERTLLILVADHGESLGQHGEPSHSVFCYESTLRVPLLVRYPDRWHAGVHTSEIVTVVDVYPTALEAMGLAREPDLDGESLFKRTVADDRGVYFESYCGYLNFGWSPIAGFVDRRGKYIHSATPELFDLAADPREKQNLVRNASPDVDRYRASIAAVESKPPIAVDDAKGIDDAMRARIQGLGYAGAGDPAAAVPSALAPTDRPSPRDRKQELRDYYRATLQGNDGDRQGGIELLQGIVKDNPHNVAALDMLGAFLVMEKRYSEGALVLEQQLAIGPERSTTHATLAQCFERTREFEKALAHFRRAQELKPGGEEQTKDVVRLLERLGRHDEAEKVRAAANEK